MLIASQCALWIIRLSTFTMKTWDLNWTSAQNTWLWPGLGLVPKHSGTSSVTRSTKLSHNRFNPQQSVCEPTPSELRVSDESATFKEHYNAFIFVIGRSQHIVMGSSILYTPVQRKKKYIYIHGPTPNLCVNHGRITKQPFLGIIDRL